MDGLLHWDFSAGLAVADQVRRRFRSTVHFSPGFNTKEFFLVVTFSLASFPLSVDSVAVALQCCIGGSSAGFKVSRLSDRSFKFSVASNKVGHFIYKLQDRVWPDFVCHFHLFKQGVVDYGFLDNHWYSDHEPVVTSAQRSLAIMPDLSSLTSSARGDHSANKELSKFGLVQDSFSGRNPMHSFEMSVHASSPEVAPEPAIPSGPRSQIIQFGSFVCPVTMQETADPIPSIVANNPLDRSELILWESIAENTLYHILDAGQAEYSEADIMAMFNLSSLPPTDFIHERLNKCQLCSVIGHSQDSCPGIDCLRCHQLQNVCNACYNLQHTRHKLSRACSCCNNTTHEVWFCPALTKCNKCGFLGHLARECKLGPHVRKSYFWRELSERQLRRKKQRRTRKVWVPKQRVLEPNPNTCANHTQPPRIPSINSAPIEQTPLQNPSPSAPPPNSMTYPQPLNLQTPSENTESPTSPPPAMANFPAIPFRYIPMAATIERGPDSRLARNMMVMDEPPLNHERYAIVSIDPEVPDHQKDMVLLEIVRIIKVDFQTRVVDSFVYPIGVGMIEFAEVTDCDEVIREGPHQYDDDALFSLVPHDEAICI